MILYRWSRCLVTKRSLVSYFKPKIWHCGIRCLAILAIVFLAFAITYFQSDLIQILGKSATYPRNTFNTVHISHLITQCRNSIVQWLYHYTVTEISLKKYFACTGIRTPTFRFMCSCAGDSNLTFQVQRHRRGGSRQKFQFKLKLKQRRGRQLARQSLLVEVHASWPDP